MDGSQIGKHAFLTANLQAAAAERAQIRHAAPSQKAEDARTVKAAINEMGEKAAKHYEEDYMRADEYLFASFSFWNLNPLDGSFAYSRDQLITARGAITAELQASCSRH